MSVRLPFTNLTPSPSKPELVLSNGTEFLVLNTSTGEIVRSYPKEADRNQKYADLHRSAAYSKDGSQLATTGDDKQIRVYDTNTWELKYTRPTAKRVNALQFTKDLSKIIVADKFGDVYAHPAEAAASAEDKLAPIAGHVSMVTDMLLTPDEKYVITGDRDEHIRVSRFPNGYNIESFCLGHTDVVTSLKLIPNTHFLLSAGGDNTVRVWDFVKGIEAQCLDIKDYIQKYIPEATDANSADAIVRRVTLDPTSNMIALAFAKTPAVVLLAWEQDQLVYKDTLETKQIVLDAAFDTEGRLWLTHPDEPLVSVFTKQGDAYSRVAEDDTLVKSINSVEAGLAEKLPDLYTIFGLRKLLDLPEHVQNGPQTKSQKKRKLENKTEE
ncbi:WD40-repeat-containing domain protein [Syncephalastrum racemosum]|uniref:WD40-repeat-containing domain protein n=1 Tax=Syncephalastrum racemosum TaxID=13706 RepID=A0A1X2HJL1_SYNRA|nr:WD40-repeat-containing domain protein [Syncephalastrum racemosum]